MSNILRNAHPVQNEHRTGCATNDLNPGVQNQAYYYLKERVIGAWVFTIPLLVLSILSMYIPYSNEIQMVLALIVMVFFGASFYIKAWELARLGRSNMNTLVALSTSVAFLLSVFNTFFPEFWIDRGVDSHIYYAVSVIVISFILTGKLMEERAKGNASTAIRQLRGLQPEVARYLPEAERMDDRIAGLVVPIALFLSFSTFVLWIYFGGTAMVSHAFLAALSILIIACPCALGLATPIALIAGIIRSSNNHILVKDAIALEQMSKVDVVVFDKTGTLTEGHPTVTGWLWAQSQEDHFKNVLLAAELKSTHPLANTIIIALEEEGILPADLESYEIISGKGIKVIHNGVEYWVGSHKLLRDYQANLSDVLVDMLVQYESDGNSIVYFGRENDLLAIVAIKEQLRGTSAEAIKELRGRDIDICMLTGDGERTASAVAASLGILKFVADAMPEDKEDFIRELQLQGKTVAMVGDGINDTQALACANVGIAMAQGTDMAMDVAMVTLKTSDLLLLPKALRISRQTVRLMNKNLFWTFIYNIICIPVAAGILYPVYGILLTPLLASAAMALSCISVLFNSLKVKY